MIATPPTPLPTAPPGCRIPHRSVRLLKAGPLAIPAGAVPAGAYREVRLIVYVDARGRVLRTQTMQRSGSPGFDAAVVRAAASSIYGPKITNCRPVASGYFFIVQDGSPPPER